jgi:NADPH2:quinone reductase
MAAPAPRPEEDLRAIQITEFGGPEVLALTELDEPEVPEGFELLDVAAAGVNYADTHQAENSYLAPAEVPLVPGGEEVGTTADGRRVVALLQGGGYAEKAVFHPAMAWEVPDGVSDEAALALVLQGTTAWHLLRTSAQLREGESVVVQAAAGGVGTLAVQLAKRFGAGRVIGVASSEEKRELVERLGADATIDAGAEGMKEALLEANGGQHVDVVLEMVGGQVFEECMSALAHFGRLVIFGMAAREGAPEVSPGKLMATSRGVVGFWLMHLVRQPERIGEALTDMFAAVAAGELETITGGSYSLEDARQAHEDIRSRKTTGKLVIRP